MEKRKHGSSKCAFGCYCLIRFAIRPSRSAAVELVCGEHNSLLDVQEPMTCEYMLWMSTPCACDDDAVEQAAKAVGLCEGPEA
jgi:hypothetical protein